MFRILIPVDFSEGSYKACLYALQLAAKVPDAKLLLLHCFQDYLADTDLLPNSAAGMTPSEQITDRVLHRNLASCQSGCWTHRGLEIPKMFPKQSALLWTQAQK